MIRKLRSRFILAAMVSLTLVLAVILGGINLVSYHKTVSDADAILALLAENRGVFPPRMQFEEPHRPNGARGIGGREFSPEAPYESRFFTVFLRDTGGTVLKLDRIAAVDPETAENYARSAVQSGREQGFRGDYRYCVSVVDGMTQVIFLDCGRSLSAFRTTLFASLAVAAAGLAAVLVLLILVSGKIVKPVAESYEKQKRFITDAGHELKTPLTIIGADADLLELELGENEWLADIRRQIQRLTGLTGDLIYLSRMDEEQPKMQMLEFPVSDVVEETAQSFQSLACQQGKKMTVTVKPMLSLNGSEKEIRQLVSILLDNAVKYSEEGGSMTLRLEQDGMGVCLNVTNSTRNPMEPEAVAHLFDRFYRMDASRNSDTGGYGLGLSIARSIVLAHKGRIKAEAPERNTLSITVWLP